MAGEQGAVEGERVHDGGPLARLLASASVSRGTQYAASASLAFLASISAWALHSTLGAFDVLLLLAAITAASLHGGTGPGLFAVVLCSLAYAPLHGGPSAAWLEEPDPVHRLLFFVGFAAIDVWVAGALGATWRHSHARRRRAEARANEHRIAADLGVRALAENDIEALLGQTLGAVQEALHCDSVTMLELAPSGDALLLRKVAGIGTALVGARYTAAEAPLAFRTIAAGSSIAIEDLRAHGDLASPVLVANGVASSITAPIAVPGPGGKPLGILGAHWRERRSISGDDVSFLRTAANVVGTAVVRLQAEERLRDQFEFLRAIAASLAEGVYAADRAGHFTFVNDAACRMLGYTRAELLARSLADVARSPQAGRRCAEEAILEVVAGGQAVQAQDDAFLRKDGTLLPVAYTASPLWRGGEVGGVVVAFQDFTEHVRVEAKEKLLSEASRQLALTLDLDETLARVARVTVPALGDWCLVVVKDELGRPRRVTTAAADPARAAAARELLERYPVDLAASHGVGRILRTGEPELIPEITADDFADGDERTPRENILKRVGLRSYVGAPLEVGGRVLGALAFGISEGPRRFGPDDLHLAQELARRCAVAIENASLYRAAREATRARDEVLAIVSHDLQTPLGALLLGASMVEKLAPQGTEGEPLRRASSTVRRAGERMRRLVHDLVDLAGLDAGRLSIRPCACEASALARETAEARAPLAAEAEVRVEVDADPVPLACDRDRVGQVLGNLVANAVRVTPPGGEVVVRVAPGDGEVVFMVTDTGPGIPTDEQARIFDRWYRGRNASYAGHGLGLAIARGLVEAHGGRIWVESVPGAGATFAFALPFGTGAHASAAP
ncbi:MAG: ATP-binding protein [Anaeromyxobacteraceae bacterium]